MRTTDEKLLEEAKEVWEKKGIAPKELYKRYLVLLSECRRLQNIANKQS